MRVEHWNEKKDGKLTEEMLRAKLESKGYSVTRYVYPPGTYFPNHTHDVDKIDSVISGRFKMTTNDGEAVLEKGDCLLVPRQTVHSAEVLGDEAVVSLDAIKR